MEEITKTVTYKKRTIEVKCEVGDSIESAYDLLDELIEESKEEIDELINSK
jgi:hypothetical protein